MSRSGFTLIEVMIALSLAAIAMSVAVATFTGATDAIAVITRQARQHEEEAIARAWLDQALTGVRVSPDPRLEFVGAPDSAAFHTHLWTPQGWLEPAHVRIRVAGARLELTVNSTTLLTLLDSLHSATIEYVEAQDGISEWRSQWLSITAFPAAVRFRYSRVGSPPDTMIFQVGTR